MSTGENAHPEPEAEQNPVKQRARSELEAQIIFKAWRDDAFRQELLRNPKAVAARELGITIPDGIHIHVHEETPTSFHFVLPMNPVTVPQAGELSDAELEAALVISPKVWE